MFKMSVQPNILDGKDTDVDYENIENFTFQPSVGFKVFSKVKKLTYEELRNIYQSLSSSNKSKMDEIVPDFTNLLYHIISISFAGNSVQEDYIWRTDEKFHNNNNNIKTINESVSNTFKKKRNALKIVKDVTFLFYSEKWEIIKRDILNDNQILCVECDECAVCLSEFKNYDVSYTNCGHKIHSSCLISLKKKECPICRNFIGNSMSEQDYIEESNASFFLKTAVVTTGFIFGLTVLPIAVIGMGIYVVGKQVAVNVSNIINFNRNIISQEENNV